MCNDLYQPCTVDHGPILQVFYSAGLTCRFYVLITKTGSLITSRKSVGGRESMNCNALSISTCEAWKVSEGGTWISMCTSLLLNSTLIVQESACFLHVLIYLHPSELYSMDSTTPLCKNP
jgi:hypothetical protein